MIEAHGYRVIRFWNSDVLRNTDGVLQVILHEIALARNEAPPPPPPRRGGGDDTRS